MFFLIEVDRCRCSHSQVAVNMGTCVPFLGAEVALFKGTWRGLLVSLNMQLHLMSAPSHKDTSKPSRKCFLDPQWLTFNLFWLLVFPTKNDDEPKKVRAFFGKETEGLRFG